MLSLHQAIGIMSIDELCERTETEKRLFLPYPVSEKCIIPKKYNFETHHISLVIAQGCLFSLL